MAVLALGAFAFQSIHLLQAGAPYSDEGAYALAGRLLLEGRLPHRDFPLFHMPLLPLLLGASLKLFGGLYPARFLYLTLNCLTIFPLYLFLRSLRPSRAAALTAAFFYLAFHEMVHHDFRWVAIRPFANTLLLLFAWISTLRPASQSSARWLQLSQFALICFSALLFFPTLLNFGLLCLAFIASEPDLALRRERWKLAFLLGLAGSASVVGYWLLMPGSYQQIVVEQMQRNRIPLGDRFETMFASPVDGYFYTLALASWLSSLVFLPRLRPFSLAMLALWAANLFVPSNFYPHYAVLAAPAFCLGVYLFVLQVEALLPKLLGIGPAQAGAAGGLLIAAVQILLVGGSLAKEMFTVNPEHHALIAALARAPGPVLTVQADYIVEAGQTIEDELLELAMRPPSPRTPWTQPDFWLAAAEKSGSLLLDPRTLFYLNQLPPTLLETWIRKYQVILSNRAGTLIVTRR